jgi:hypothetical protein
MRHARKSTRWTGNEGTVRWGGLTRPTRQPAKGETRASNPFAGGNEGTSEKAPQATFSYELE